MRFLTSVSFLILSLFSSAQQRKPNIIFILADDVAIGDLGCYGQKLIKTPRLDELAAEGTRYTQAYAGASVCSPSRTSLLTGLHGGHAPIRGNREALAGKSRFGGGQLPIPDAVVTVAEALRTEGYATGCFGKWGMGQFDTPGSPLKQGFDRFYGYNGQVQAHNYFPPSLQDGEKIIELPENAKGAKKVYAQNLIQKETLDWVRSVKDKPFFLFYAITLPHAQYEIDDVGEYAARADWTEKERVYAAMVTRMDTDIGQLGDLLKELKLDENTLIVFMGDNGSSFAPDSPIGKRFHQATDANLRGFKRSVYEGGLRQAAFVRWPGVVKAGRVSDEPWAAWDLLPTAVAIANVRNKPAHYRTDGVSLIDFWKGSAAPKRECFFWELHEAGFRQAVRFDQWKAIRNAPKATLELYDLSKDASESHNVAAEHPDLVRKAEALIKSSHEDDPNWPIPAKNRTR